MPEPVLLSFDLEEFDIVREFGGEIDDDQLMRVSVAGCESLLALLDLHQVTCTFFITAYFAERNEKLVRQIARRHETASHGYEHSRFEDADLAKSKASLERITEQPVVGFRRARLAETNMQAVVDAGYRYDSSMNPTWLPGRYNHLNEPRRIHRVHPQLVQLPISTMPWTRFPIFWLSLKNLPVGAMSWMSRRAAASDGYFTTFTHPWEFADLSPWPLPGYVRRTHGERWLDKLGRLIDRWKRIGPFITMHQFVAQWTQQHTETPSDESR